MTAVVDVSPDATAPDATALDGCRVAVTRAEPGELGRMLAAAGADVVHVPLIAVDDPADGGRALADALRRLDDHDWLIVTSPNGAERVGRVAATNDVRLAAVGTATARRLADLAGRDVDLVPGRQLGAALAEAFVSRHRDHPQRVLLAVADRADDALASELAAHGHDVTSVVAYRTVLRRPSDDELAELTSCDAVVFASGSAAIGWAEALGDAAVAALPRHVVAIGPSTAAAAGRYDLKMTAVAADHSLAGVVDELIEQWQASR